LTSRFPSVASRSSSTASAHSGRAKLDNDAERKNLLRAAGWQLVAVTFTMLRHHPERVVAIVKTARDELDPIQWEKPFEDRTVDPNERLRPV
jgi:hypothetical protein